MGHVAHELGHEPFSRVQSECPFHYAPEKGSWSNNTQKQHYLYSASTFDRDRVGCCLEDNENKLSPRKTQLPKVKCSVLGQPS